MSAATYDRQKDERLLMCNQLIEQLQLELSGMTQQLAKSKEEQHQQQRSAQALFGQSPQKPPPPSSSQNGNEQEMTAARKLDDLQVDNMTLRQQLGGAQAELDGLRQLCAHFLQSDQREQSAAAEGGY